MKNKTISKIIFTRVFVIITLSSILTLIAGIWIIRDYYLRISLNELLPDAIRISEALSTDPNQAVFTDRTDIIVKAYDASLAESFNLIIPKVTFDSGPDVASSDESEKTFHHPVITDSVIKEALSPYMNSLLSGKSVRDIRSLPPLKGTSIVVGLPIVKNDIVIGALLVLHPTVEYNSTFYGFLYSYGFLVLAFSLFISVVLYLSIRNIVKPLKAMSELAQNLTNGHYNGYLEQNEFYEIKVLADSLNTLSTQLKSERDKTELLERKRDEYFSNVSHELKSPLIAIRGMSEAINDHMITDPSELERYHAVIFSESIRMQQLIDDMLYLSRLKDSQDSIQMVTLDLRDLLEKFVTKYRIIADDMDISFTSVLPSEPVYILGSEQLIQQVFSCLVDNAIKFTPSEGNISIQMEHTSESILIKVADSGHGIAPEDLPYIFDRYFKADKARQYKGSGLGLAITKAIVELLSGEIEVMSQVKKGTEFLIRFPAI